MHYFKHAAWMLKLVFCIFKKTMPQNFYTTNILCFLIWSYHAVAIPVDNGVEGDPEIECGADAVNINFNTRNPFEGHVFVKGRFKEPECKNTGTGDPVVSLSLGFTKCGTARTRSLNPLGMFVSFTVMITFHPQFVTKVT